MTKTIILGITGGIAAYKAVDLVSTLRKNNYNVHVVCTKNALQFVSPLSLEVMSGNKVWFNDNRQELSSQIEHIKLSQGADLILIAPATANSIAKLASGISDELLYDLVLASRSPIVIAPAMNTNMWNHPTVQKNLQTLVNDLNYQIIDPEFGELACGYIGEGRLADIDRIVNKVNVILAEESVIASVAKQSSLGSIADITKITITMGPSREYLDPVRYISNASSGKMGIALAKAALAEGYRVDLISSLPIDSSLSSQVKYISFETNDELKSAIQISMQDSNALIMAAAVVDYTPRERLSHKIKKNGNNLELELKATEDILANLPRREGQVIIGFSVETDNIAENALRKIQSKNLDLIVANPVTALGADSTEIEIVYNPKYQTLKSHYKVAGTKPELAQVILDSFKQVRSLDKSQV